MCELLTYVLLMQLQHVAAAEVFGGVNVVTAWQLCCDEE